jgi:GNAT superfamily N-acetyltransferase
MSTSLGFLIRDGLDSDIGACLNLDHHFETDYVWQMRYAEDTDQRQIIFQIEKLPRILETSWDVSEHRLRLAVPAEHCFLIAQDRDQGDILGYLTMRHDPVYQIAQLQDLVVSFPYRRRKIGTRLLTVARNWAREHGLVRLTAEIMTRNYPGIQFCQHTGLTFSGFNDQYFPKQDIALFFSSSLR